MSYFLSLPGGPRQRRRFQSPMETLLGEFFDDITISPYGERYAAVPDLFPHVMLRPSSRSDTKKPWIQIFNMRGFTSQEIDVNIHDDNLVIHAKHEAGEEGNNDKYEKMRTVKIPKDIDREKISCFLNSDGRFFVKGLYVKEEPQEIIPERVTEKLEDSQSEKAEGGQDKPEAEGAIANKEGESSEGKAEELKTVKSLADFLLDALTGPFDNGGNTDDLVLFGDGNPHFGTELSVKNKSLAPMMDSQEIIEKDDKKLLQVKVNLGEFAPENISIRCQDKTIYVDAKKEVETEGMYQMQEFHREYAVPENGVSKEAKATVSDKGMVCLLVPLVEQPEHTEIPIAHEQKSE